MTTTVKAGGPAHFLSLVPQMLGFMPKRSLVLVPFAGQRTIGVMRFDYPPHETFDAAAASIIGMVCRVEGATGYAAIAYPDASATEAHVPELLSAIAGRAHQVGLDPIDLMYVTPEVWCTTSDNVEHPISELAGYEQVLEVSADILDDTRLPAVPVERRDAVAAAYEQLREAITITTGEYPDEYPISATTEVLVTIAELSDLPSLYESVLTEDPIEPVRIAALKWCFDRPALRDIALVQWSASFAAGDEALDAQLAWEEGVEYPTHLAMAMWGEGDQPNPDRLKQALVVAGIVAAHIPSAGALSMMAWISWALGRSTHAEHYAQQALELEPQHGLSEIVQSFVDAGHLPAWAFVKPSS